MRRLAIYVRRDDIAAGVPEDASRCPVARALRRATDYHEEVTVGPRSLILRGFMRRRDRVTSLPEPAREFIRRFDNHESVEPFLFHVEFPA